MYTQKQREGQRKSHAWRTAFGRGTVKVSLSEPNKARIIAQLRELGHEVEQVGKGTRLHFPKLGETMHIQTAYHKFISKGVQA